MEANIVDLQTLFQEQVSYRIPQFQRSYAWKEDRQWKPLWADVCNVAERCLNREEEDAEVLPHFMGAIVLQRRKNSTGEVTKRLGSVDSSMEPDKGGDKTQKSKIADSQLFETRKDTILLMKHSTRCLSLYECFSCIPWSIRLVQGAIDAIAPFAQKTAMKSSESNSLPAIT